MKLDKDVEMRVPRLNVSTRFGGELSSAVRRHLGSGFQVVSLVQTAVLSEDGEKPSSHWKKMGGSGEEHSTIIIIWYKSEKTFNFFSYVIHNTLCCHCFLLKTTE